MPIDWDRIERRGTAREESELWSVFHENSKTSRHDPAPTNEEVAARMQQLWESLPYEGHPRFPLPDPSVALDHPIGRALRGRATGRNLRPVQLRPDSLAAMLHSAYGITRDNKGTSFPRPFRTVPSGGALYPLELYVHTAYVEGLTPGLYHFNPVDHSLRLLQRGDSTRQIGQALVQPDLALGVSMFVFITALFERSVFKYGNRGYRFVLLEAGHVAQNLNLSAAALGLGSINIGGYHDREIDQLLGIDGVQQSTVYMIGVGGNDGGGGQ